MRKSILTTFLSLITMTLVLGEDPPTAAKVASPSLIFLSANSSKVTLNNGTMEIQADALEQKTDGDTVILTLNGKAKIKHSGQVNGSFTVSANRILLSSPVNTIKNDVSKSLFRLDATGSCDFASDSIHISADRITQRTTSENLGSSFMFNDNVIITTDGLTAFATSVTLSRSGTTWTLAGLLAAPKDGG